MVQHFDRDNQHDGANVRLVSDLTTIVSTTFLSQLQPTNTSLYLIPLPLLPPSAIFYTIKRYGPIVFTVIMTTRQMLSIVLSTILFGHTMGTEAMFGAVIVFLAVFHSIHRQVRESKERKAVKDAAPATNEGTGESKLVQGGLELANTSNRG